MPDLMKIGGVTGWMQTAALADASGTPVSTHLFIEFSSHVLAATPGRHFLEWMDLASPMLAEDLPDVTNGFLTPTSGPGAGLHWNEKSVHAYSA
jgi:mandelate racemase